jgi:predicted DNA-binding antitoxin AbrB/MazE fold protein
MIQHVNAIYEHGVLKPLGPLELSEHEVVSLSVEKTAKAETETNEDGPTLFELLDKAGLIGCIKDGPPDLSTNPKYMEDFGKSAT